MFTFWLISNTLHSFKINKTKLSLLLGYTLNQLLKQFFRSDYFTVCCVASVKGTLDSRGSGWARPAGWPLCVGCLSTQGCSSRTESSFTAPSAAECPAARAPSLSLDLFDLSFLTSLSAKKTSLQLRSPSFKYLSPALLPFTRVGSKVLDFSWGLRWARRADSLYT